MSEYKPIGYFVAGPRNTLYRLGSRHPDYPLDFCQIRAVDNGVGGFYLYIDNAGYEKDLTAGYWEPVGLDGKPFCFDKTGKTVLPEDEYTGGSVSYYKVQVNAPTTEGNPPYLAECNDIIEALNMNYAEGNAFKALWRRAAARQGVAKRGYTDGLYDAEKVVFFGQRLVEQEKASKEK